MPNDIPKVTLITDDSPSAQLSRATTQEFDVTDSLGRVIRLKKPRPLANLDFAKAAGSDKLNLLYLAEVAHLKYVAAIDGDLVTTPASEMQLRALYQRLGDEGNLAAQIGVAANFMEADTTAEDAEVKKS